MANIINAKGMIKQKTEMAVQRNLWGYNTGNNRSWTITVNSKIKDLAVIFDNKDDTTVNKVTATVNGKNGVKNLSQTGSGRWLSVVANIDDYVTTIVCGATCSNGGQTIAHVTYNKIIE